MKRRQKTSSIMTKGRAFAIYLTASITIFLIFLGIMFFVWYPAPYFAIDGGWEVLRILSNSHFAVSRRVGGLP